MKKAVFKCLGLLSVFVLLMFGVSACESGESSRSNVHNHSFTKYVSNNDATTEKDGTETAICDNGCGETDTRVETGTRLIEVKTYIDGEFFANVYTCEKQEYKITFPEVGEDITMNPYANKYFYGWFSDMGYNEKVSSSTTFDKDTKIYAKWIMADETVFTYSVSGGNATITGFKKNEQTILVVPKIINTFPVTTIGDRAFSNKTMIKKLIICDGVEEIKGGAFSSCTSMTELILPATLKEIGSGAFLGCSIEELIIPEGLETIDRYAFGNCKKLYLITFNAISCSFRGRQPKNIDNNPFDGAINVKVVIGEQVKRIDSDIFIGIASIEFVFKDPNPRGWYKYSMIWQDDLLSGGFWRYGGSVAVDDVHKDMKFLTRYEIFVKKDDVS